MRNKKVSSDVERFASLTDPVHPDISRLVERIKDNSDSEIEVIHSIGRELLGNFWDYSPKYVDPSLLDEVGKEGVYFNGNNLLEFYERINNGEISFWKEYSEETGIENPKRLMGEWLEKREKELRKKGRENPILFVSSRNAGEIYEQRYLGEGGGCSNYTTVMAEAVRAAGIPVKLIFFLKTNEEMIEAARGFRGLFGHYMGCCYADNSWRLYDFKWQWNPFYDWFYSGQEEGIFRFGYRRNLDVKYIPVTNDGEYDPEEPLSSPNFGFREIKESPETKRFARKFLEKNRGLE